VTVPILLAGGVGAGWFLGAPGVTDEARDAALASLLANLGAVPPEGTLIVVDFSRPSQTRRLGVRDLGTGRWIQQARVTHGKNSGMVYARDLSDEPGSLKSSAGLFRVGELFDGVHGPSLRLEGLEPGRNGNAEDRGIIVHAADYASLTTVFLNWREKFRLGRSEGCFALTPGAFGRLVRELTPPAYLYAYRPEDSDANPARATASANAPGCP